MAVPKRGSQMYMMALRQYNINRKRGGVISQITHSADFFVFASFPLCCGGASMVGPFLDFSSLILPSMIAKYRQIAPSRVPHHFSVTFNTSRKRPQADKRSAATSRRTLLTIDTTSQ